MVCGSQGQDFRFGASWTIVAGGTAQGKIQNLAACNAEECKGSSPVGDEKWVVALTVTVVTVRRRMVFGLQTNDINL